MSYLANQTSNTEFGLVKIGNNVNVSEGTIWVPKIVAGSGVTVESNTDFITVSSTGADLISVYGTNTNYTAAGNDEYIGVFSASAVTITLPAGTTGRVYTVKDEYGQGSGKITIQPDGAEKIDGKNNYVISVPYQAVSLVFRAGQWRLI